MPTPSVPDRIPTPERRLSIPELQEEAKRLITVCDALYEQLTTWPPAERDWEYSYVGQALSYGHRRIEVILDEIELAKRVRLTDAGRVALAVA